MQENYISDTPQETNDYEVLVVNIHWNKDKAYGKYASKKDFSKSLPDTFTYSLPDNILAKKDCNDFFDLVETFTYNLLAYRFNYTANRCQIFLPLEQD